MASSFSTAERSASSGSNNNTPGSGPFIMDTTSLSIPRDIWIIYYPQAPMSSMNDDYKIASHCAGYFKQHHRLINVADLQQTGAVRIACTSLPPFLANTHETIRMKPTVFLNMLALALHCAIDALKVSFTFPRVVVRLEGFLPATPIRLVRSNLIDRFVTIRGTAVRVGSVRPLVLGMGFDCPLCAQRIDVTFTDGQYNPPLACTGYRCRSKMFVPDRKSARAIDWQLVRVQEVVGVDDVGQGRTPRTIDCELTNDLVDTIAPGDAVIVSGLVKARRPISRSRVTNTRAQSLFQLYIDVNSIRKAPRSAIDLAEDEVEEDPINRSGEHDVADDGTYTTDVDTTDNVSGARGSSQYHDRHAHPRTYTATAAQLLSLAQRPDIVHVLIESFCPSIYGQSNAKLGILLALFGGVPIEQSLYSSTTVRGDSHVLIVGDPGLGKSQLLRFAATISPRGVYVGGNISTSSGLTVTMVRDKSGAGGRCSDFALEPGALVLADEGVCCVDELDKLMQDHSSLLEAMEQQTVSVAKAGVVCTLNAKTCVIAAANPVTGRYDVRKTILENLKMNTALLTRFDLVFLLRDKSDRELDSKVSEHVMRMHSGDASYDSYGSHTGRGDSIDWSVRKHGQTESAPLGNIGFDGSIMAPSLMRRYITYARLNVRPSLTVEAKAVLEQFYLQLRARSRAYSGDVPVTVRQLESLVRLTQARARMQLRNIATSTDASEVVALVKEAHASVEDMSGGGMISTGPGGRVKETSKAKQFQLFIEGMKRASRRKNSPIFELRELRDLATDLNLRVDNFEVFIDTLNNQGMLLQMGNKRFKLAEYR